MGLSTIRSLTVNFTFTKKAKGTKIEPIYLHSINSPLSLGYVRVLNKNVDLLGINWLNFLQRETHRLRRNKGCWHRVETLSVYCENSAGISANYALIAGTDGR